MTAVARVYRWEIAKLLAQKRTYLGLGTAMVVPIIFVVVLVLQTGGPNDVPLGRYIRDTGLAVPFVVLFFMSIWGLPLDDRARRRRHRRLGESQRDAEDDPHALARARRGLRGQGARDAGPTPSRSCSRWASSGSSPGSIAWGFHPLTSLSGTKVSRRPRPAAAPREPGHLLAARSPGSPPSASCSRP